MKYEDYHVLTKKIKVNLARLKTNIRLIYETTENSSIGKTSA